MYNAPNANIKTPQNSKALRLEMLEYRPWTWKVPEGSKKMTPAITTF
jgi:hypothetical protein